MGPDLAREAYGPALLKGVEALSSEIARGFGEWIDLGLVDGELPAFHGAQADGCNPVATAFSDGHDVCRPQRPQTIAKSLAIGDPADGVYALELARRTGGSVESSMIDVYFSARYFSICRSASVPAVPAAPERCSVTTPELSAATSASSAIPRPPRPQSALPRDWPPEPLPHSALDRASPWLEGRPCRM